MKIRLFCLLFLSIFISCVENETVKIEKAIEKVNGSFPVKYEIGEIVGLSLNKEDNSLVITSAINDGMLNMDAINKHPEVMNAVASNLVLSMKEERNVKDLLEMITDAGMSVSIVYKEKMSDKEIAGNVSSLQLKELLSRHDSHQSVAQDYVKLQVELSKLSLPMQIDWMTEWIDMKYENDEVKYIYSLKEGEYVDFSTSEQKRNFAENVRLLISENIIRQVSGYEASATKVFFEGVRNAGAMLTYEYMGDSSGESVRVSFSNSEISSLINNYGTK